MTRVVLLSIIATASRAASSGRHRITTSAAFSASRRAPASLALRIVERDQRIFGAIAQPIDDLEPVVPAAPSIKIRVVIRNRSFRNVSDCKGRPSPRPSTAQVKDVKSITRQQFTDNG